MQKAKKFKIPGDIIIIPMFIGCAINSLLPQVLQIGGFTTPIVKGAGPLVGAFLFFIDVLYVIWVDKFLLIATLELDVVLRVLLVRHGECCVLIL